MTEEATNLSTLADRVEAATGPDREIDDEIRTAMAYTYETGTLAPRYTASLDAAMTLVPEGWDSRRVGCTDDGRGYAQLAADDGAMMAEDTEDISPISFGGRSVMAPARAFRSMSCGCLASGACWIFYCARKLRS
jgi:hypothetical protein